MSWENILKKRTLLKRKIREIMSDGKARTSGEIVGILKELEDRRMQFTPSQVGALLKQSDFIVVGNIMSPHSHKIPLYQLRE